MDSNLRKALAFLKKNYKLFSEIQEHDIGQHLYAYHLEIGDSLKISGKTQSSCLFLIQGAVELEKLGQPSTVLTSANLKKQPIITNDQEVTFTARNKSTLARINLEHLDFLLAWSEMEKSSFSDESFQHWLQSIKEPLIFKNIPLGNIKKICESFEDISVKKGDEVVIQGERGDFFYLIESGEAEVWQLGLDDDKPSLVATLREMDHFGEDALIMDGSRNATVKMSTDGQLKRLNKDDFNELINQPMKHQVSSHVAKVMIEKEGSLLLDVRYDEEYELERMDNAVFIPLHELRGRLQELDKKENYIVYCHAGPRSTVAAHVLNQNGFTASSLIGGLREWPYDKLSFE